MKEEIHMKKILSLVLAVLVIMAMTIPAFAVEEDVAPCAVICTTHTKGTYQGRSYTSEYGSTTICYTVVTDFYECATCHKIYSVLVSKTAGSHSTSVLSASCNGTTQTWVNRCTKCAFKITTYHPCPKPGHISGNCNWLPI